MDTFVKKQARSSNDIDTDNLLAGQKTYDNSGNN